MVKLSKPKVSDMVFERTFTDEIAFLANEGSAYMKIKCRAGGWANPELIKMRDEIQVWRQSKVLGMAGIMDNPEQYAEQNADIERQVGQKMFEALYEACVVEWSTNIEDNGKPMKCNKDNFVALADVRIEEIAKFFVDFAKFVDDLANFRADIDQATVKN